MDLDLHVWRFDWAQPSSTMGARVGDLARRAEGIGVRTLSFMDHYFQMDAMAPATDPMLEGYTALGFVAGLTDSLRLRLLVTGVTYRHPGLLAKIVTTLDVLSAGRAELGIGAAWYEREHRGLGVEFPPTAERFERLEEAIQICLQMWSDDDGPYRGVHYQLDETLCHPGPVSAPRPRIMIGGGGERKTRATSSGHRLSSRTRSTCCGATATSSAATSARSRSRRCFATSGQTRLPTTSSAAPSRSLASVSQRSSRHRSATTRPRRSKRRSDPRSTASLPSNPSHSDESRWCGVQPGQASSFLMAPPNTVER